MFTIGFTKKLHIVVLNKISYILFADDTNIFATGKNLAELTNMLNTELAKLNQWIKFNRLLVLQHARSNRGGGGGYPDRNMTIV